MNKSPIKQIYLLLVIIGGFVSLSIYSTYALFTYEQVTENVATINTLDHLTIDTKINEYKRIKLDANSFTTINIEVNNYGEDELCYGVWYEALGNIKNIYMYRANENVITTGTISSIKTETVPIVAINNNNDEVYINIGVNSSNANNCSLNLKDDAILITEIYEEKYLNDYILKQIDDEEIIKESEYQEIENYIITLDDSKLIVSNDYKFKDGLFTLTNPFEIDINDYEFKEQEIYYFQLDNNLHEMYKINTIKESELITTKFIGFISSINGLIKYDNNLEYYGANPNNYICLNNNENSCEMYRIIGLFIDENNEKYNVKIVKNDFLGEAKYSNTSNLMIDNNVNSNIYDYLEDYYDNSLTENVKNMIIEYPYKTDYNDDNSKELIDIYNYNSLNNYNLNVGLLSLTDYLYASNCNDKKLNEYNQECYANNWLNKYNQEMLINRLDTGTSSIYTISNGIEKTSYDKELNIRPVLYLKDDITYILGDGTINNPFIIR